MTTQDTGTSIRASELFVLYGALLENKLLIGTVLIFVLHPVKELINQTFGDGSIFQLGQNVQYSNY
jgi:hypothetical protein